MASKIPSYFTPDLFDREVKGTIEWRLDPTEVNSGGVISFANITVRDAGTWISVALHSLEHDWLLFWYSGKYMLRVPKRITNLSSSATELCNWLRGVDLPNLNYGLNNSVYCEDGTMTAFCLYLHKHAVDIKNVSEIPRFVNVEPFRLAIIEGNNI